jgi:hypothetical protein
MENQTNGAKRKSLPKWLSIVLIIGGLFLVITGVMQILSGATAKALVNKFNAFQEPTTKLGNDLKSAGTLLSSIGPKEQAKDYAGIVTDLQTAVAQLTDAEVAANSLLSLTTEFKGLINKSSDQEIKTAGLHFIDVSNSRNTAVLKMTADTKEFINLIITYYTELSQGKPGTLDESKVATMADQLTANSEAIAKLSAELETATQDLATAADFTLTKKE